jgi:hypothetical protein
LIESLPQHQLLLKAICFQVLKNLFQFCIPQRRLRRRQRSQFLQPFRHFHRQQQQDTLLELEEQTLDFQQA